MLAACSAPPPEAGTRRNAAAQAGQAPAADADGPATRKVASALQGQRGEGSPYEVVGSEVWAVPDPISRREYQVFVALPADYAQNAQRRYPVLYVTDADYAFPLIRQMARRLNGEGPAIEDFILVGLSYALGEDGMTSRRRDYTPTPGRASSAPADAVHGESQAYAAYLRDEVLPFVASRYRTDEQRRMFLGHSYGALLGTEILQTQPSLFAGYVLGSPSYWYDEQYLLRRQRERDAAQQTVPAKVYLYVGDQETRAHGKHFDMVDDTREMAALLEKSASLQLHVDVLQDEDHLSVAPRGFMHGLKYLLGLPRPE